MLHALAAVADTARGRARRVFFTLQAFFVYYRFVLPAQYMSLWRVFALFAIADAVSSYWLAILFQANHVVEAVRLCLSLALAEACWRN